MWQIYTTEYYSTTKKMKFISNLTELENIISGEVTLTQKDNCRMFSFRGGVVVEVCDTFLLMFVL